MPRKKVEHKYHFIYKTTNLKNGKFYIGMHSTDDLNDGYLGSGTKLRRSIRRHGIENFKLEILEFLQDRDSLKEKEKELVNEDLLKDPMCMNLKTGGEGGISSEEHRKKFLFNAKKTQIPNLNKGRETQKRLWNTNETWASIMRTKLSNNAKANKGYTGMKHSSETKAKIGKSNSDKQSGVGNSQFGTCWITNGIENRKIKKGNILPDGWKIGRSIFK